MNRTEALKVLHLDEGSDSHAVETSYWTLVRHAQTRSPDETTAAREVERLNKAYAALTPTPSPMEMVRTSQKPARVVGAARAAMAAGSMPPQTTSSALPWLGGGDASTFVSDGPDAMPKLRLSAAPLLRWQSPRSWPTPRCSSSWHASRSSSLGYGHAVAQRAP